MRLVEKITPWQITRVKGMCLFALISFGIQFCSSRLADAKIKVEEYEGPYLFGGTEYDLY